MHLSDFQAFFVCHPDPCLMIDHQGAVLRVNAAFADLVRTEVVPGTPAVEIVPRAERYLLTKALHTIGSGAAEARFSAHLRGVAGRVDWTLRPGDACWLAFLRHRPGAAQRDAQTAQAISDGNKLRATLEALPDIMMEFDRDGRFLNFHCPPTLALAVSPDAFLGRRIEEVLPPDVAEVGRRAMAQIDATGRSSGLRYTIPDPVTKAETWFEISGAARQGNDGGYLFLLRDVTAQVAAARDLQYHAHQQQALHDLSPIGITLTNMQTRCLVDANPAFLAISGYDHSEIAGLSSDRVISPDDVEARQIARRQLEDTGRFGPIEIECIRRDGSRFPARLSGAMMTAPSLGNDSARRYLWTLIEDVSADKARRGRLRRAEQLAVTARQQLLGAIDSLSDGFVLYDADDRLVMVNAAYRRLYSEDEAISQPGTLFADIIRHCIQRGDYPDAVGREEEFFSERMAQHRTATHSVEHRLSGGRVVRIEERPLPDGGRVGLHVQVTDLHRAREAAEEASRTKSAFLAHMGHEIRTPLAGILGMTELLMDNLDRPEQMALARAVHQSGETLLTILNDLLDMSKIEAGKLDLEAVAFDPADLARHVSALYELRAEGKSLHYGVEVTAGAMGLRLGDPHRIAQILHNLLSNALKFTHIGGMTLSLSGGPDTLVLSVRDSGIGMTQDQVARMLNPFEQADPQTTRRYGGTGLGMSIVARLVDMMGGRIEVQSSLGAGTEVQIHLPLPMVAAPQTDNPQPVSVPVDASALRGLRVLAADDNEINRHMLQGYLDRFGVDVTMVEDGTEALVRWEPGAFDLICLDISMPGLDGPAALQLIRAKAEAQGARVPPAIAITSNAMTHQIADYMAAGFAAHLGKPFRKDDLIRVLGSHAPRRASPRAKLPKGVPAA
jgi:PAS domain S-box-containing protein